MNINTRDQLCQLIQLFVHCIIIYVVGMFREIYFCSQKVEISEKSLHPSPPPLNVIFSSSSSFQRKKTNDIHVSNIKLLIIRTLIISHFKFDCVSHGHRYAYVKNDISVHYFNRGATQKVTTCFFQQTLILFCTRFWCFHILLKDYQILRYHHLFLFQ